jgi:hypothetical protein
VESDDAVGSVAGCKHAFAVSVDAAAVVNVVVYAVVIV